MNVSGIRFRWAVIETIGTNFFPIASNRFSSRENVIDVSIDEVAGRCEL